MTSRAESRTGLPPLMDFDRATATIAYEMYHFRCLAQLYRDGKAEGGFWGQVCAQSLLLHLRIMIEFFYGKRPNDQDVTIKQFLAADGFSFSPELQEVPERMLLTSKTPNRPRSMTMREVKEALNQRLVHFGIGRWHGYHPGLDDYEPCFDDLEARIVAFRKALPEHLMIIFDNRLRQFQTRDKNITVPIASAPTLNW